MKYSLLFYCIELYSKIYFIEGERIMPSQYYMGKKFSSSSLTESSISNQIEDNIKTAPSSHVAKTINDKIDNYIESTDEQINKINNIISNPNLLDNPWFTVNQRGFSSGYGTNYLVDRWKGATGTTNAYAVNSDKSIKITRNYSGDGRIIAQIFENELQAGTYTISVLANGQSDVPISISLRDASDSNINGISFVLDGTKKIMSATVNIESAAKIISVGLGQVGASADIYAIKLERGTASTLANDSAPDYAIELVKCQRYCIALKGSTDLRVRAIAVTTNTIDFTIPIPTTMRARPTLVNNGISIYNTSLTQQSGFTLAVIGSTDLTILMRATKTSHGLSDAVLYVNTTSFLSADL